MGEADATSTVNRVNGVVAEIGYLGDISIYHVRTAGGRLIQAQLTNRSRTEHAGPTWDQPVEFVLACNLWCGAGIMNAREITGLSMLIAGL